MKRALLVVLASLVFVGGAAAAQANSRPRVTLYNDANDVEMLVAALESAKRVFALV